MVSAKKKIYMTFASILVSVSIVIGLGINVLADTTAKSDVGIVLKTSSLKVDKVIVSPNVSEINGNNNDLSRGSSGSANQLVNYAYNFIGTPYVYGANGPNSFDCSGFTKYIYSYFSINIPRTSQSQYNSGVSINRNELQSGDLVFFNTDSYLGHVGIYIGNGDFIHASSSKGVTISSLNEGYYSETYAAAVRY